MPDSSTVDHPEQYPAGRRRARRRARQAECHRLGLSRHLVAKFPVISLANGRVVDIQARLDDNVKKGQLLLNVQSPDVTNAFDTYLKAVNDEQLANKAYVRAKDLYKHGAISQAMLEQAEDAENDAKADLDRGRRAVEDPRRRQESPQQHRERVCAHLRRHRRAERDQRRGGRRHLSGSATAFTIADLCVVWILCDVYENDLPKVHLGQEAQISSARIPTRCSPAASAISARCSIPPSAPPRCASRLPNPGMLRLGMFVTATLLSRSHSHARRRAGQRHPAPARSRLGLCARRRQPVPARRSDRRRHAARQQQEILSGIAPGQQVVQRRSGTGSNGGGAMIRRLVDFALQNRLLVLAHRHSALRLGHRLVPSPARRGLSRRGQQLCRRDRAVAGHLRRADRAAGHHPH